MKLTNKHTEYQNWVNELKSLIQKTQIKAAIAVNRELLKLYWSIGKSISEKVNKANWGSAVVEELAKDLKTELPTIEDIELVTTKAIHSATESDKIKNNE